MAVAPTASISIICGGAFAGIEPAAANLATHKTLSGSSTCAIPIARLLEKGQERTRRPGVPSPLPKGRFSTSTFLTDDEKDVFKTAFEIDQRWIVEHAGDRSEYICQSQSINLFLPADIHKRDLHQLHLQAWKRA